MATAEILQESEVTIDSIEAIFKRAFMSTSRDNDGDLVVRSDGPRVIITVNEDTKLLKFMSLYGFKDSRSIAAKHAFINRMNGDVIFARFSVPEQHPTTLVSDYFISYEEGIPAFQIVSTFRWFSKIVPAAIMQSDEDDLVE